MAVTEAAIDSGIAPRGHRDSVSGLGGHAAHPPRDLQRTFQLWLAAIWLLDAVLQLQPFMFTPGANGLSGMIGGTAAGNPGWIAHTITWNASVVDHSPVVTNTLFALVQFLIAFGIIWRRTCRPALVLSVIWALGVWWFGEGLGAVFSGGATPFGGGPGGVLFYALLAVLLWPREGPDRPFVAARAVGARAARLVWVGTWGVLAVLCVVGAGRSPTALRDVISDTAKGEPGWLTSLDRYTSALFLHDGTALAILLAVLCCVAALAVALPPRATRVVIVLVVVAFTLIWVAVQNLGGMLAGGATDPSSGPLVVLLALAYWPIGGAQPIGPSAPTGGA